MQARNLLGRTNRTEKFILNYNINSKKNNAQDATKGKEFF